MAVRTCGFLFAVLVGSAMGVHVNPMRRVVTMLQDMSKKIAEEGEREEKQFDKFMCYCKTGGGKLEKSIADAETKIPQLESALKEAEATVTQLKADVKQHNADKAAADTAMKDATGIRDKEAAAFSQASADAKANIDAMGKAIAALEKGMGGAFIQTSNAALLQKLAASSEMTDDDRDAVASFLSNGYSPQSGQITGILKQMLDTSVSDLAKDTKDEADAKSEYDSLMAAKKREVDALQGMVEEKTKRIGESGVQVVNMADDLDDTTVALAEDKKFLGDLSKNCDTKKAEGEVRQKLRAEEQLALADTIKLLNDDDALDLFKKTLPSPAFVQVQVSSKEMRNQAREALRGHHDGRLDLISLALRGRKVNFDKVLGMIDEMVQLLAEEQTGDDEKKAYCAKEFDESDDEKKALERAIANIDTTIEDTKATLATVTEDITTLEKGIKDLDAQVSEATAARKEAHKTYVEDLAANNAAKELLDIAKNRLNKFYNPKLYKAAPKRELSEEERISVNMGGTMAPTAPPGGIAGTGVTSLLSRDAPGPAPEMPGEYQKKGEESTGVIAMIDGLKAELSKEIQEMEFEEKEDQKDYEQMIKDSGEKRAVDSKSAATKAGEKADMEAALQTSLGEKKSKTAEAMANAKYISDLHGECDWLISNYDTRKEARAGEVDSLKTAKAVLSGADYSLVQLQMTRGRGLRGSA